MGLLRLINAARLAPLEELLAELRGGAPASGASAASSRTATAVAASIPAMPRREATPPPASFALAPKLPAREPSVLVRERDEQRISPEQPKMAVPQEPPQASAPPQTEPSLTARVSGITDAQVTEIKQAIQAQQKFLGELIEQASRWELDGAELRLYFSPSNRSFAEMLEGREQLEKLRNVSGKVLGRAVRVCAKLEAVAAAAASASRAGSANQELRAQFERDPMVKSMLQRFGGKIAEVKHRPEET
jgi:hypothetical protein